MKANQVTHRLSFHRIIAPLAVAALSLTAACGDDDPEVEMEDDGPEVFTTLELTFSPDGGTAGENVVVTFQDDDADGVGSGVITPEMIMLAAQTSYTLSFRVANTTLPVGEQDDIQQEIMDEQDGHQFFVFGPMVNGPATDNPTAPITHTYADMDSNDLPIGFVNDIQTGAAAPAGDFTVLLRHLPPVDGTVQKLPDLEGTLRTGGIEALPGQTDIIVTYNIGVE